MAKKRIAKRKLKIKRFLNKSPNATLKEIVSATGCVSSYAHIVRKEWLEEQQESPASKLVAGIVENIKSVASVPRLKDDIYRSEDLETQLQLLGVHEDDRKILVSFAERLEKRIQWQLVRLNEAYRLIGSNTVDECMEY
jgi:hypothetical protein